MAAVELVGGCAHALCKEALQIGMNRAVIFADDVPAWLRFPGGSSDSSFEQVGFWSPLRRQNKLFLVLGQITGERVDAFRKQPDTSVLDVDVRKDIRLWEIRLLCLRCLVGVRSERSDVYQPGDTDNRAADPTDCCFCYSDVFCR